MSSVSLTPYLLSMRVTELRWWKPPTIKMALMAWPLLYIETMMLSRSCLASAALVFGYTAKLRCSVCFAERHRHFRERAYHLEHSFSCKCRKQIVGRVQLVVDGDEAYHLHTAESRISDNSQLPRTALLSF